jgi:NTP pyrophosphatase (non-canonical NTP hydrolase)
MTHPNLVKSILKSGEAILLSLSPNKCHDLHMAVGVCTEAGELLDAAKKYIFYEKPLDRENVIEELGDIEFYLEGLRQGLGITREETLDHNIAKLSKRYHSLTFTNAHAQERLDKQ